MYSNIKSASPKRGSVPAEGVVQHLAEVTYALNELDRVKIIRHGLPAVVMPRLGESIGMSNDQLIATLGFPRTTVIRKIRDDQALTREQTERVLGLEKLIGQVLAMVEQSGTGESFDAGRWVGQWLATPLPALDGAKPADYMDTIEGQQMVARLLAQAQSGAYA